MKHGLRVAWVGLILLLAAPVAAGQASATPRTGAADTVRTAQADPPSLLSRLLRRPAPRTEPKVVGPVQPPQPEAQYGSPRLSTASPNPANSEVRIEYAFGSNQTALLQIYDFLGKPVRSMVLRKGSSSIVLDVANLPPGLYFYSLEVDGKLVATKRLSISR